MPRLWIALTVASLVAFGVAACGGDDDYGGSADAPPASATASAAATIKVVQNEKLGALLADGAGLTLYVFTQDSPGKSTCTDSCAATWPPLLTTAPDAPKVDGATGEFSLVGRPDGSKQVAFNGRPLYRYGPDMAPGEARGEGLGGVWFVAKASGTAAASTPGTAGQDAYGY